MELTFLGTGSAYPTPTRAASCIIFRNNGTYWMFDCGEGSQIQLMRSPIRPGKISKIFITHLHGDHVFGLPGLLCTISQNFSSDQKEPIEIFGPEGLHKFVRTSLQLSRSQLGFDFIVHELLPSPEQYPDNWEEWKVEHSENGPLHPNERLGRTISADEDGVWHVCEDTDLTVTGGRLRHPVPSFAFIIQEKPTPGKLDAALLKAKGVPPGPLYAQLKKGLSITSPSGETIQPEDVVGPERPGRKVVILGDTRESLQLVPLAMNADAIVHEATLENEMKDNALEKGHSTPGMAAEFAVESRAKMLILTHFSQRYQPLSQDSQDGKERVSTGSSSQATKSNNSETDRPSEASPEDDNTVRKLQIQGEEGFKIGKVVMAEDFKTVKIPQRQL